MLRYNKLYLIVQRNLAIKGARGTVRASPQCNEGPKGRRWNRPNGVEM